MQVATLVLSFVVALATVLYTWVNYKMLMESKATRMQKSEPIIVPYLQSTADHTSIMLYVKNVGEGCARNVVAHVVKDYNFYGKDMTFKDFDLFSEGVSIYPPQYELHYVFDSWDNIKDHDDYIEFDIEYDGMDGRHYSDNHFQLRLKEIGRIYSNPPEDAFSQIPYYLKEVDRTLNKINTKIGKAQNS